jgi:TetR/AcrR family transcriptional repressor of nem operon
MPWPKGHKARTRERIIEAAAEAFRARGVAGVRVEQIMADAGLTHGGFYAHFSSKDDLVGPALERASGQTLEMLGTVARSREADERFGAAIDAYLSRAHAAHPERGCPVAALGAEVARSGGAARRDLAHGIKERIAWMRELLPKRWTRGDREQDEHVVGTLACMVGGVILARAAGGKEADAILEACRRFLHRALEASATPAGARRDGSAGRPLEHG